MCNRSLAHGTLFCAECYIAREVFNRVPLAYLSFLFYFSFFFSLHSWWALSYESSRHKGGHQVVLFTLTKSYQQIGPAQYGGLRNYNKEYLSNKTIALNIKYTLKTEKRAENILIFFYSYSY